MEFNDRLGCSIPFEEAAAVIEIESHRAEVIAVNVPCCTEVVTVAVEIRAGVVIDVAVDSCAAVVINRACACDVGVAIGCNGIVDDDVVALSKQIR